MSFSAFAIFLLLVTAVAVFQIFIASPLVVQKTDLLRVVTGEDVKWRTTASAELARGRIELVALPAPGRAERVFHAVGDSIAIDDTLATFVNPEISTELFDAEQRLLQARADDEAQSSASRIEQLTLDDDVAAAKAQVRRAEQSLRLVELLLPKNLAAASEKDQATYELDMAKEHLSRTLQRATLTVSGSLARARSRADQIRGLIRAVAMKQQQVEQLSIRARRSGVVSDVFVEPGQWITQGSAVFRIRTGDDLYGEVKLSDLDAADIRAGNAVIVRFRSDTAVGVVTGVDPVAKGGIVSVHFRVPSPQTGSRSPESLADVEVMTASSANAVLVEAPVGARSHAAGRVLVLNDERSRAVWRTVRWGRRAGSKLEVLGGIRPGETIVRASEGVNADASSFRVRVGS
jgi:HlyD family secretion protein